MGTTIFASVFESALNPAPRRSGGMHYANIEIIHKVIHPFFLDGLKDELEKIREITVQLQGKEITGDSGLFLCFLCNFESNVK